MVMLVFKCPTTSLHTQHWLDDEDDDSANEAYESITCPACAKLHFVNRKSRKLLGQDDE